MPHPMPRTCLRFVCALAALAVAITGGGNPVRADSSYADMVVGVQNKVVKIHGVGGFRGLEAYQSGMLISGDGHVLTAWSYVIDTDTITVTLDDGRRFKAALVAADPRIEVALLKIEASDLPHFDLASAPTAVEGTRVLAFSNLFDVAVGNEPVSVQHGIVAIVTRLEARRGVFETPYRGEVYVLDAVTNNPGAAGGALTNDRGHLIGMLGKELRNSLNHTWLNYAVPIGELAPTVDAMLSGQFAASTSQGDFPTPVNPLDLEMLGLVLVPDVVERTPPFIDAIRRGSPAAEAGLRPDDLVLFVNERLVQSCKALVSELSHFDQSEPLKLTVGRDRDLVDVVIQPAGEVSTP